MPHHNEIRIMGHLGADATLKEINKPRKDRRQTNPGEILRD